MKFAVGGIDAARLVAIAAVAAHGLTDLAALQRVCFFYAAAWWLPDSIATAAFFVASVVHLAGDWGGSAWASACFHAGLLCVDAAVGREEAADAMLVYMVGVHVPNHYCVEVRAGRFRSVAVAALGTAAVAAHGLHVLRTLGGKARFVLTERMQRIVVAHAVSRMVAF